MNLFENLQILNESEDNILFKFKWEKGSINDNIIKYLQSKNIKFRYSEYFQLEAKIKGTWVRFDYKKKDDGLTYIYVGSKNNKVTKESYGMEKYSYVSPADKFNNLKINNPTYNFKDPNRDEDHMIESLLDYDKWFDINYNNLVQDFIEKYEITEDEIEENEDLFYEYVDDKYEEYYKNTNNYLDNEIEENFNDSDKNEEHVVESIMNFDNWLDKYFDELVKNYAELYNMNEMDVSDEDEDFEEYVNIKYNEYHRKMNNYLKYKQLSNSELEEDFEVADTKQKYTSAKTSINSSKLPAIFKMVSFKPGTINLDFGGGRFDNVADYLSKDDVTNLVYDPYNRSSEHNKNVLNKIKEIGGADSATISNVLNVIAEPEARKTVLQNVYNLIKSGAPVYITVYEGNSSGEAGETKSGYQLNRKTVDYLEEIQEVFPNAKRKGKLITATK